MAQIDCILYETSHCHLCDEAQQVLLPFVQHEICSVELIDIAEHSELLERFGTLIPVLLHSPTQLQLNWPFDEASVAQFLQQCRATV